MKKFVSILAAALLVLGTVGQALAYFEDFHLIRVIYKSGGAEVANDLGLITDLLGQTNKTVGAGALETNLSSFGAGTTWADLNIAYLAVGPTAGTAGKYEAWLSGGTGIVPVSGNRKWTNLTTNEKATQGYYSGLAGTGSGEKQVIADSTNLQSYVTGMNTPGNLAKFNGFYGATGYGEANLGALASGGVVDVNLYYFDWVGTAASFPITTGDFAMLIRTYIDAPNSAGTILNPGSPVVPIPGALWLLGSGLLGLIGLRRKSA